MLKDSTYFISSTLKKYLNKNISLQLTFLGQLPFPVLLFDKENLIRFFNHEVLKSFNFKESELADSPVQKLLLSQGEKQNPSEIPNLIKSRKFKSFEKEITGGNGKRQNVIISFKPSEIFGSLPMMELFFQILPGVNKVSGIQKINSDSLAVANMAYWELNSEKSQFTFSKECFRLLATSSVSGSISYVDLLATLPRKEDRETIEKGLISITNTDQIFRTDFKVKSYLIDGSENRVLRMYSKWISDNRSGYYAGFFQDISENKKIEKELLKAKEKAERADRLKSHFLTNLSYEIRTPMNAILGFAELLNQGDLSKEQKHDYAKIIRLKGNSLLTQIDEVTELSKFETGNIAINKTEFELNPLLTDLYTEYEAKRIQKAKTNIKLELKVPDELANEMIFTDPGRLEQMLSNLLSNAIKFTEKGEIEFGYKKSGKFYKFFVKDTGIGIEEEDQNLIFNKFHEIEDIPTKKYGGSGLNLTISKHIVELLGGKIKLKSEPNKGSRFQINIPVESSRKKTSDLTEFNELDSVNWKDRVILIAEDEDVNFRFLEAVLEKSQTQILRAKTGREAVELCKNISKIDLVLMDIKMPVMNGFDATVEIKKSRPLLPVIAQTAFSGKDETLKCQQSGCDDIITKPIDIKLLIQKISNQLH